MPIENRRFTCRDRTFEVRTVRRPNEWLIQTFEGDKPVGPRYSVTTEIASDFRLTGIKVPLVF
jgi:hypothetical protein